MSKNCRICRLLQEHIDLLRYLLFGALTTLVNFLIYFPCYNLLFLSAAVSNMIAWIVSVAFAFVTNKQFVFQSNDWHKKTWLGELVKFTGCRLASGVMETSILWVAVDMLRWNGNGFKILVSILVVIFNYIGSKWFVFNKTR